MLGGQQANSAQIQRLLLIGKTRRKFIESGRQEKTTPWGENLVTNDRPTGTGYLGSVPWGTHLREFQSTREELADTLVPNAPDVPNPSGIWLTRLQNPARWL